MPTFHFPLDPLLRQRRHAERERQRVVAELERARRRLEDALRERQSFITTSKHAYGDRLTGVLDATDLRAHAADTMRLMREAQRIVVELAGVHNRLDDAKEHLREAMRARRAIEILRERRFEAWKRDLSRREDAQLDELAGRAAYRDSQQ